MNSPVKSAVAAFSAAVLMGCGGVVTYHRPPGVVYAPASPDWSVAGHAPLPPRVVIEQPQPVSLYYSSSLDCYVDPFTASTRCYDMVFPRYAQTAPPMWLDFYANDNCYYPRGYGRHNSLWVGVIDMPGLGMTWGLSLSDVLIFSSHGRHHGAYHNYRHRRDHHDYRDHHGEHDNGHHGNRRGRDRHDGDRHNGDRYNDNGRGGFSGRGEDRDQGGRQQRQFQQPPTTRQPRLGSRRSFDQRPDTGRVRGRGSQPQMPRQHFNRQAPDITRGMGQRMPRSMERAPRQQMQRPRIQQAPRMQRQPQPRINSGGSRGGGFQNRRGDGNTPRRGR